MALIHCYECGKKISETAPTCPECGAKQHIKPKSNNIFLVAFIIVLLGIGGYFAFQYFSNSGSDSSSKITIPGGNYKLVKSQANGFLAKAVHTLEKVSMNAKGLGSNIKVVGDTIQSDGLISDAVTGFTGGTNRFPIEKGNGDNEYVLDLPGNDKVPMNYYTSEKNLVLHLQGDSLVYQKEN
jgi:hypothetical protein